MTWPCDRGCCSRATGSGTPPPILELLRKAASSDLDDFFVFLIGDSILDLDAAPSGGARYPVEARMDGRTFTKFHLDVSAGDVLREP